MIILEASLWLYEKSLQIISFFNLQNMRPLPIYELNLHSSLFLSQSQTADKMSNDDLFRFLADLKLPEMQRGATKRLKKV